MEEMPCIRLARGKFELTNQDSAGGKNSSVLTSSRNQATFVAGDDTKRDLQFQKPKQLAKSEKYEPFCVFKLLFWRQKWVTGALHGNSLVVRRVSPGRILVVLF